MLLLLFCVRQSRPGTVCIYTLGQIFCLLEGLLSPIHTADADATQLSSWVASAVCIEFATSWRQSRRVSTSQNNLPTTKSSCVVSAVWTHQSSVVTQFPIFCASHQLSRVGVASASAVCIEFATSSQRLPTTADENLETEHVENLSCRVESSWVVSAVCTRPLAVVTQFTILQPMGDK